MDKRRGGIRTPISQNDDNLFDFLRALEAIGKSVGAVVMIGSMFKMSFVIEGSPSDSILKILIDNAKWFAPAMIVGALMVWAGAYAGRKFNRMMAERNR